MKIYRYYFLLSLIILIMVPLAGCSSNEALSEEKLVEIEIENEKTVINIEELSVAEFKKQIVLKNDTLFILDIRYPEDYNKNYVEGSVNIPFSEVPDRLNELPKDKKILIICYLGKTAVGVGEDLEKQGYKPIVLSGGFKAIEEVEFETIANE